MMTISKTLPTHPFWNFSTKIYRYPIVEENLLVLQNERGLNVNVILFCCWYALNDQGRLSKNELRQILVSIQPWHERIVTPLRRLRQQLKSINQSRWQAIRSEIMQHELIGEQIEQLILLEKFVYKTRPLRSNVQKIVDICKNIVTYCQLLHAFLDSRDCRNISNILTAIFPKIDPEDILRYCIENLRQKDVQAPSLTAQLPLDL